MKIVISPTTRIVLFLLVIVIIPLMITTEKGTSSATYKVTSKDVKSSKNQNWEYVKDRVTIKGGETPYLKKGPILIEVMHATKEDSVAVSRNIEELRKLLPHKTIDYFSHHIGQHLFEDMPTRTPKNSIIPKPVELYNSVLVIYFLKNQTKSTASTSILSNGIFISREDRLARSRRFGKRSVPESMFMHFPENISDEERYKYVRYDLYRWLCLIDSEKQYSYSIRDGEGILNTPDFIPDFNTRTDNDIFLLKKLYSDDFIDQFETYLYANYPWRYSSRFMSKGKSKLMAYLVISVLLIVLFLLVFPVFKKAPFKIEFVNYFICILIIYTSILYSSNIYNYFMQLHIQLTIFGAFLIPFAVVLVISLIISLLLWGLEKLFIGNHKHIIQNYVLHFVFTSFALNAPLFLIMYLDMFYEDLEFVIPFALLFIALSLLRVFLIYLNRNSEMLMRKKDVQLSQLKELQVATELNSLHAQINPHFLYNALNSIASLAHIDSDKTEKMALSLSDLFRYSVNRKGEKLSTIEEEVTMVENYLEIEKIRFEDRLEFSLEVDSSLQQTKIPRFVLQPLIENAVKHGISKVKDKGSIELHIYKKHKNLLITISDNGPDFPDGLISGHGLQSVFDLLRLSYGEQASMNWENLPKKKITVIIKSNF